MKLGPFKLEEWFAKYEFSAPYLLCCSDCETLSIGELLKMSSDPSPVDKLLEFRLGYTECNGAQSLREAVSSHLYSAVSADQILVHAGAEEAIFTFFMQFGPGDHVVVMAPCYQSLVEVARARGVEVSLWVLQEVAIDPAAEESETRWAVDMGALPTLLKDNTRAVVINSPHNPTGAVVQRQELDDIISLCRSRSLTLFSDEVYSGLEYQTGSCPAVPKACDLYERAVSLGVLSKAQGLPGLRIGWAASQDKALLDAMCGVKLYTSICSSGPSEHLAEIAVQNSGALCSRNVTIIQDNLKALQALLDDFKHILSWSKPDAGCIGLLKLSSTLDCTAETFAKAAIEQAGVLLLPSEYFDFGTSHLRIGFGRADFKKSLDQFRHFLKQYAVEHPSTEVGMS